MATVSCGGTSARYRFIQRFGVDLGVKKLCVWLGVSRSGYYDWLKREPSQRDLDNQLLKQHIQAIYDKSSCRYGSPRIWRVLRRQGWCISQKRVAKLMQMMGLIARVTRVTYRAPGMRHFLVAGENLRPDGAIPAKKNQVWVADVTYLNVKKQRHYLSV